MKRFRLLLIGVLLAVVVFACSDETSDESTVGLVTTESRESSLPEGPASTATTTPITPSTTADSSSGVELIEPHSPRTWAQCDYVVDPVLVAVDDLTRNVPPDLSNESYVGFIARIDAASVARDETGTRLLALGEVWDSHCVDAGAQLEQVVTAHLAAADEWRVCLESGSCDPAELDANLRTAWADAQALFDQARAALDAMDPASVQADDPLTQ